MDSRAKYDEIEHTVTTKGWKILKEEFDKRKESLKVLLMDCDLTYPESLILAKKYQNDFKAIDEFFEMTHDILTSLQEEIDNV